MGVAGLLLQTDLVVFISRTERLLLFCVCFGQQILDDCRLHVLLGRRVAQGRGIGLRLSVFV